jgi:hypothetical protein
MRAKFGKTLRKERVVVITGAIDGNLTKIDVITLKD